ncbi:unnamed protein product, partial [Meganyctiphanes norvegica]
SNMAQEYQYFYEDEVYRFNKKGNLELGMVLENAEFASSDDDSDIDEEDKVTKGSIRVAWYPKGEEQVLPERKTGFVDKRPLCSHISSPFMKGEPRDGYRSPIYCDQSCYTPPGSVLWSRAVILPLERN